MHKKLFALSLLVGLLLASCSSPAEQPPVVEQVECPDVDVSACPEVEVPTCPEVEACEEAIPVLPDIEAAWAGSGHANSEAEAFRHWDEDDPAIVAQACAKCHSAASYQEFVTTGSITSETPAQENQGITCAACHNEGTQTKTSVVMPSGIELTGLGDEARCMECHQGRESTVSVNNRIAAAAGIEVVVADDAEDPVHAAITAAAEAAGQADPDMIYEDLGFANIHYFAAAATKYGTFAKGGFEYEGKTYDGNFAHVEEYDTCLECHDPHTLEVEVEGCATCHGEGEPREFRMLGSSVDYDGDSNIEEGMAEEIAGLQEALYSAIQAYAVDTVGTGIVYDSHSYPYFFIDADGDGALTEGEANYGNRYAAWTPRLLKAAYNYQTSQKDPGAFAHGGKYIVQLLYDSIDDLGSDVTALYRNDHGHFQGSAEAFRHWDEEGEVPGRCSRCHSAEGLPLFMTQGVTINQEVSNGFQCATCHGGDEWPARYGTSEVTFPSGAKVALEEGDDAGLCMSCHQGRESGASVARLVADKPADEVSDGLRFLNIHYFAAGATRYGSDVGGGYEYEGQEYVGYFEHVNGFQSCADCHDAHELEVKTAECATCHADFEDVRDIRMNDVDYDGDGDVVEGMFSEIDTLRDALYAAMQTYAADNDATDQIVYNSARYPYYFNEAGDRYTTWTPALLEAAYNYQYALKDPGGFAHNGKYVVQLLIDAINALGGDVSIFARP